MHWNGWPVVLFALSTLACLLRRRWWDAVTSACFTAFVVFDRLLPNALPEQLKYSFAVMGAVLVVTGVMNEYDRYKKSLVEH
jgi:hypothetical protein